MNSPPMAEILEMIKEKYGGSENSIVYKIVKISTRCSTSVLCDTEIVWKYDDLCVKMFDLDISGWEISEQISDEVQNRYLGSSFNLVTIRMTRAI